MDADFNRESFTEISRAIIRDCLFFRVLLGQDARVNLSSILLYYSYGMLKNGTAQHGKRLEPALRSGAIKNMSLEYFIDYLINTKHPSAHKPAPGDWNEDELRLLGDINITLPVTIFDEGQHQNPKPQKPF